MFKKGRMKSRKEAKNVNQETIKREREKRVYKRISKLSREKYIIKIFRLALLRPALFPVETLRDW